MKNHQLARLLLCVFVTLGLSQAYGQKKPKKATSPPAAKTATSVDPVAVPEGSADLAAEEEPPEENMDALEDQLQKDIDFERTRLNVPTKKWITPQTVDYSKTLSVKSYADMVAMQKNFMPKSGRFQASLGASWLTNDNFYLNYGGQARLGYHFDEVYGVELIGSYLTSSDTYKVEDLKDKQRIAVTSLVTPKQFIGGALFLNPLYGKWAVNNRSISAFDIYQTIGAGKLTTSADTDTTAIFLGLGQMTSLSRNQFWRVDLSWYFYSAKTSTNNTQSFNSLFLTVYWGGFFPTVGSRQ